ncbi:hypothetical protein RRG08_041208 [Elysia crispata]|uniref:Uncharacterized protein n=1 Tax=Elysia crispata TaxID=231223 RepID=A0AAE1B8S3_9GAST|nr:hypothetical protein RRG08_041208 [Elysia crispata]
MYTRRPSSGVKPSSTYRGQKITQLSGGKGNTEGFETPADSEQMSVRMPCHKAISSMLQALCHKATRALCHKATRALGHRATGALGHKAAGALGHKATRALGHKSTRALGHKATRAVVYNKIRRLLHICKGYPQT